MLALLGPFGGPDGQGNADDEKKKHADHHGKVHLGGALLDIYDRLAGGLWFKAHGRDALRVGRKVPWDRPIPAPVVRGGFAGREGAGAVIISTLDPPGARGFFRPSFA